MTTGVEVHAEIEKIARLLRTEPERLHYLQEVGAPGLRELREQLTERMFSAGRGTFAKLAAASRIVPASVAATISERAFGPLITARMSTAVEPPAAIAVAKRLSAGFLADVAVEMDPRRAAAVIGGLPAELIANASAELAARGEWVTMGRFVGHLSEEALAATTALLSDEELLRVALVTEEPRRLPAIFDSLDDQRRAALVSLARETGVLDRLGPGMGAA